MPQTNSEKAMYSASHSVNAAGLDRDTLINKLGALWENNKQYLEIKENAGCYSVYFTATAATREKAKEMSANAAANIKKRLNGYCYGIDDEGLDEIVFSLLKSHGVTVATAEFYNGEVISADLTDISVGKTGSPIKHIGDFEAEQLGINQNSVKEQGECSPALAADLACFVRKTGGADIGLSVCSYKAGKVCFGLCDGDKIWVKTAHFNSDGAVKAEKFVKEHSAALLLNMLRCYLSADNDFLHLGTNINAELNVVDALLGTVTVYEYKQADFALDKENSVEPSKTSSRKKEKKSFWKCIFPCKGDRVSDVILKIVAIIAAITFLASAGYIGSYYLDAGKQQNIITEAKKQVDFTDMTINKETQTYAKFDDLYAQNNDLRGWLTINNTNVDNPVYQHTDNDYYIKYNMEKKRNSHGALFIDSTCTLTSESRSKNLTIYGHSMKDGTMFGTLKRYRKLDFYKQNPTFSFETLYSPSTEYKIFSIFVTNSTPEQNDGYVFNYTIPDFETDSTFLAWVDDVKERSFFDLPVDVESTDEIITLSTCEYDFDGARLVIVARKTRDGESTSVDTSGASVNPDPIMPQGWYDVYG